MKRYVVILLFSKTNKKLLMVKRAKNPYKNMWNGIGGKIEENETEIEAAIRECREETNIDICNPKIYIRYIYPKENKYNPGTDLTVLYDFVDEVEVKENEEGIYEWKDIGFAMNFDSKEIAGFSNIAQFIKEIYHLEKIKMFI